MEFRWQGVKKLSNLGFDDCRAKRKAFKSLVLRQTRLLIKTGLFFFLFVIIGVFAFIGCSFDLKS